MIESKEGMVYPDFPLLARHRMGFVVLFYSDECGTIVSSENGDYSVGLHSRWVSCFDTTYWTLFLPGKSITLTQR